MRGTLESFASCRVGRDVLALGAVLALAGCPTSHASSSEVGPRDAPVRDTPSSAPRDAPVPPLDGSAPPRRLAFVFAAADFPEISPDGRELVGLNLDGRISDGTGLACTEEQDYVSPITGVSGVDNQFASQVAPLLRSMLGPEGWAGAFAGSFARGDALIVLELTDVDSLASDSMLDVHAFFGRPSEGGAPLLDATGRLRPGQRFAVAEELGRGRGAIVEGRLEATLPLLPLRLPLGGALFELPLHELSLTADVTASSLSEGEAGGSLAVADFVRAVEVLGLGIDEATVRAVAHPDLELDPATGECGAISTALRFDAVSAIVVP